MRQVALWVVMSVLLAWAGAVHAAEQCDGYNYCIEQTGVLKYPYVWLRNLLAGEDQANNVLRVEHQYSRGASTGTDVLIKNGAGYLHAVTCYGSDVAATAGDIAVRDAVSAATGTILVQFQIAAALLLPQNLILDVPFSTGLYVDYTTTGDVACVLSYR